MSPFNSSMEINENSEKRYMEGKINLLIRLFFFLKEGVNQMSGLKTLAYALIGIAGVLAINKSETGYLPIILIGLVSIPVFTFLGYLWVIRGKKSEEYYQFKYTTTFSRYGIQLSEKQMELLESIDKSLKELLKNNAV